MALAAASTAATSLIVPTAGRNCGRVFSSIAGAGDVDPVSVCCKYGIKLRYSEKWQLRYAFQLRVLTQITKYRLATIEIVNKPGLHWKVTYDVTM